MVASPTAQGASRRVGRRGNHEGSITHLGDGRWQARVTLPDGRRKAVYGATRAEAAAKLTKLLRDVQQGLPVVGERQTVGQFLTTWLEDVQPQLRPSAHRRYTDHVRHVVAGLGKVPLAKLTPQQVQSFYTAKLAAGLSRTTVSLQHGCLHRALADAERMGLVQRNVAEQVRPPRRSTPETETLTEAQVAAFLGAAKGDRFEVLYRLALDTTMREGELLGLRWSDLDLDRRVLHVRMGVQEAPGKRFMLDEPKTPHSKRTIGLTRAMADALRAHRAHQNEERLAMGPLWDGTLDLVFPNGYGGIMIPHNIAKRGFKTLLRRAGLPDTLHFHCLRHTAATTLLSRGVGIKVVSEMLGHADVSITLRIYGHVTPHMQQTALDVLEGLWDGKTGATGGGVQA